MQNTASPHLGILVPAEPIDPNSHVMNPFGDSNELGMQPTGGGSQKGLQGWENGGIQVHGKFEIRSGEDSSIEHDGQW
jgi:hypothetical protein